MIFEKKTMSQRSDPGSVQVAINVRTQLESMLMITALQSYFTSHFIQFLRRVPPILVKPKVATSRVATWMLEQLHSITDVKSLLTSAAVLDPFLEADMDPSAQQDFVPYIAALGDIYAKVWDDLLRLAGQRRDITRVIIGTLNDSLQRLL